MSDCSYSRENTKQEPLSPPSGGLATEEAQAESPTQQEPLGEEGVARGEEAVAGEERDGSRDPTPPHRDESDCSNHSRDHTPTSDSRRCSQKDPTRKAPAQKQRTLRSIFAARPSLSKDAPTPEETSPPSPEEGVEATPLLPPPVPGCVGEGLCMEVAVRELTGVERLQHRLSQHMRTQHPPLLADGRPSSTQSRQSVSKSGGTPGMWRSSDQ